MPFRRRYKPKRYARKSYARVAGARRTGRIRSARQVAQIARRVVYRNRENKQICHSWTPTLSNSWVHYCINQVAQGDSQNNRDGLKIKQGSLYGNMSFQSSGSENSVVRLMVVRYVGDGDAFSTSLLPPSFLSCRTTSNRAVVKVLKDFYVTLNPVSTASGGAATQRMLKLNMRIPGLAEYESTTSDHPTKGSIFVCMICDSNTSYPTVLTELIYTFKEF